MAHAFSPRFLGSSSSFHISLPAESITKAQFRSPELISTVRCRSIGISSSSHGDDDQKDLKINGHASEEASRFSRFMHCGENTTIGLVNTLKENGNEYTWGKVTVKMAETYRFYWGDEGTVQMAYEARKRSPSGKIWIINDILDNPTVNERLRKMEVKDIPVEGLKRRLDVVCEGDVVILPAVKMSEKELYDLTEVRGAQVLDTACPLSEVWEAVKNHKKRDYTSLIYGDASHLETIATASMAGKYIIVNTTAEARYVSNYILGGKLYGYNPTKEEFLENFRAQVSEGFDPDVDLMKVGIAGQPTMYRGEIKTIGKLLMRTMMHRFGLENLDRHFYDTTKHLQATMLGLVEKKLDFILVVGEMDSSNISHVQEAAELRGIPWYWIDDKHRIGPGNKIYHKNIGGEIVVKEKWMMAGPITVGVIIGATTVKTLENILLKVFEINLKETMWFE